MSRLPRLGTEPTRHSDCCLSLSIPLLDSLTSLILSHHEPSSSLVLSIGSGTGLLEALLLRHWSSLPEARELELQGVEVATSAEPVNKYLPEQNWTTVRGTWDVLPSARGASVFMFVYPRDRKLVRRYIDIFAAAEGANLRLVIRLGPKDDWAGFQPCFGGLKRFKPVEVVNTDGMAEYEMLATMTLIK